MESAESLQWYAEIAGKAQGPFDRYEIGELFYDNEINANTLVWNSTMSDWRPLRQTTLREFLAEDDVFLGEEDDEEAHQASFVPPLPQPQSQAHLAAQAGAPVGFGNNFVQPGSGFVKPRVGANGPAYFTILLLATYPFALILWPLGIFWIVIGLASSWSGLNRARMIHKEGLALGTHNVPHQGRTASIVGLAVFGVSAFVGLVNVFTLLHIL